MPHSNNTIAQRIIAMLEARAPSSSICPSEVARALEREEGAWRALMPQVREVAAGLQDDRQVRITRGDESVSRETLHHGAIRIRRYV